MSNTIGTLSVDVLANIAGMVSGLEKAHAESARAAHGMQKHFEEAGDSIKEKFRQVAEFVGISLAVEGLKEFANQALETGEKIERMSQSLGLGANTIQTMSYAAALTGSSLDTMQAALAKLEKAGEQATTGNKKMAESFQSIGFSTQQVAALLKDPDQLIQQVTAHIAAFADGAGKTATTMVLMGKGAAENIPLIDKLGSSFKELSQRASDIGVNLTELQIKALSGTKQAFNDLGEQVRGVGNQFAIALLPALNGVVGVFGQILQSSAVKTFFSDLRDNVATLVVMAGDLRKKFGEWIDDFSKLANTSSLSFTSMKGGIIGFVEETLNEFAHLKGFILETWVALQAGAAIAWNSIRNTAVGVVHDISMNFAELLNLVSRGTQFSNPEMATGFRVAALAVADFTRTLKPVVGDLGQYERKIMDVRAQTNEEVSANMGWANSTRMAVKELLSAGHAAEDANKPLMNFNQTSVDAAKAAQKLSNAYLEMEKILGTLAAKVGGPNAKAWAEYDAAIGEATKAAAKFRTEGVSAAEAQKFVADATKLATERLLELTDATTIIDKVVRDANEGLDKQKTNLGLTAEQVKINTEYLKLLAKANIALAASMGPLTEAQQKELDKLKQIAIETVKTDEAIKNSQAVIAEWQRIAGSGFDSVGKTIADFATGAIKNWHDFGQSLLGDAKQFIAQIIEQFLKLKVFNGIIGGLFGGSGAGGGGGGYGGLISAGVAAFAGGSSGGGGGSMDMSSVIGGLVNSSVQGSGFSLFSPSSWMQSGRNLFQGFSQGSANAGSTMFGTWSGSTGSVQQVGGLGVNMPYGGAGTYTPSALGYGAAAVGGIYAGVNEYNAVGGGLRGVGAGIGYGVGTAALSLGLGSLAAGGTFAAGIGATAGTASALGASSGVAAAVPIIGWVALIAMVVDHFTGGKIFGSGWRPKDSTSNIALGADGATVTNSATMWRYQSQLSQSMGNFGGLLSPSDWGKKDWRTQNIAITPEQQKAADDFYKSIKQIMTDDAKALAIETPPMIEAALRTVNTYTKKGKVESTKIFVDMLGQSWEEATTALAAQRISVEAQIATIGASSKGKGASDIAQQWRSNLDTLTDGAGALMGMTLDLTKGFKLLGVASTATLADVVKFTQGFKAGSETLSAAYQRLEQANAAYQSFVGQFKPSAVYVDQFEQALSNINTTMKANIAQANALAKAAGAEGAEVEDLTNIHKTAAMQMVQLVLQLEDSAQSLAFALGLTDKGSLEQINAEISRLQGGANSATTAVNGYSAAVTNSSQAATAAIALLLGTLSPLSDAQKLQKALDGQRAGTVTPDQVLQIGRQLYASSEAYTRLFAQVQSIGDRTGQTGNASGAAVAISSVSSSGHSLDALIKERDLMQAAQTASQYKTLAQQIAEIAAAKGRSFEEVMKDMGVKQADLEKGLGLKSDAELKTYIANIQKQTDSNKDNTISIVNELRLILDAIRNTRVGGPDANIPGHSNRVPGSTGTTVVDLSPNTINNIGDRISRGNLGRSSRLMPTQ